MVRVKLSMCLIKYHVGNGDAAPHILKLITKWRQQVSSMAWVLYPWNPVDRRLGGSQSGLDEVAKKKIPSLLMPRIELLSSILWLTLLWLKYSNGRKISHATVCVYAFYILYI
jgi:hypothetical protein